MTMQEDAIETLQAFFTRHESGSYLDTYNALIEVAARAISGAASIYETCEPDRQGCFLCAATHDAKVRVHDIILANAMEEGGEALFEHMKKGHVLGVDEVSTDEAGIPTAKDPARGPWRGD